MRDTAGAIATAQSVFVGDVISTKDTDRIAEVKVLSVWKGRDLPQIVEVRGMTRADGSAAATDRRFEADERYLFIPENARPPFLASACSATQGFVGAPNTIPAAYQTATGQDRGRAPLTVSTQAEDEAALTTSILPLLGAIALIAVGWAVISKVRTLEPERAASFSEESAAPSRPPVVRPEEPGRKRGKKKTLRALRRMSRGH